MFQGVPSSSVPRRDKPRRVDLYYSSWCIRAGNESLHMHFSGVISKKQSGFGGFLK
jgi:hypothetical protein